MSNPDNSIDPSTRSQAATLWEFLAPIHPPEKADAIFVFGGINLKVPNHAADLFLDHYASTVLVTGGTGSRTHLHFDGPEADVFVEVLEGRGVPRESLILEPTASNTGENVEFGMAKLLESHNASTALLVAAPFIMRRCLATFELQYPHVRVIPCPPEGPFEEFVDRPYNEFLQRLVAELDRIDAYMEQGFIASVDVPADVRSAAESLRRQFPLD